jgi:hypothetical protein
MYASNRVNHELRLILLHHVIALFRVSLFHFLGNFAASLFNPATLMQSAVRTIAALIVIAASGANLGKPQQGALEKSF